MAKLIINADDFGLSRGVNHGIIDAHLNGVVTSTSLMMNQPGTIHAVQLMELVKGLGVGLHAVLTSGKPLTEVSSLVDQDGNFWRLQDFWQKDLDTQHVHRELYAQLNKLLDNGYSPTHIDSHHHVHRHPKVWPIVEEMARQYSLPIRQASLQQVHPLVTCTFLEGYFGDPSEEAFHKAVASCTPDGAYEIMCHPGYIDATVLQGSSYASERALETETLTSPTLRKWLEDQGFDLVHYGMEKGVENL